MANIQKLSKTPNSGNIRKELRSLQHANNDTTIAEKAGDEVVGLVVQSAYCRLSTRPHVHAWSPFFLVRIKRIGWQL
jgi:hypothetical protein